jgi:hypothetical protein
VAAGQQVPPAGSPSNSPAREYRAAVFERSLISWASRHQRSKPYTPRHNGKVERYQRILAEELLYARQWTSEAERARAITVWNVPYKYHGFTPPPETVLQPHASTRASPRHGQQQLDSRVSHVASFASFL